MADEIFIRKGSELMKTIVLAGGCFWGMEKLYRSFDGIENVTAGYANGCGEASANYETVCRGGTGFREAVKLEYDPPVISLEDILGIFYRVIDPTMFNRQGMDFGTQYQTGIYWTDNEDEKTVLRISSAEKQKYREFWV
ncbi:MAG: peptide-methionine (S)-S-oxide reductase, partial [Clostridiales bacterium]|nr:peptide-methionine (S)-S-oxide reductase [Clostridiales bacterium]